MKFYTCVFFNFDKKSLRKAQIFSQTLGRDIL
jgi:hypothetical protein